MSKKPPIPVLIAENRKALFDYDIIKEYEAGIKLAGYEVQSLRKGNCNFKGSFVSLSSGVPILMNFHIGKYSAAGVLSPDEQKRPRLLFIHKKDILYLRTGAEPGTMIVPTEIYFRGNLIKLKISLARARKKYEKKQVIKERDEKKILRKELSVRG